MSKSKRTIGFLKTTAIGGLLFLLPLIVIGALIGQVVPIVLTIAESLNTVLPVRTTGGIALLILLALAIVLSLCFAAGLLARWSIGKRISMEFEKKLLLLFPRYTIIKEQMAGSIGGDELKPKMKPVVARFDDSMRIGFEIERVEDGPVVVYLPGAPDPWSGYVVFLTPDRVNPLKANFTETVSTFEKLGRDSGAILAGKVSGLSQNQI